MSYQALKSVSTMRIFRDQGLNFRCIILSAFPVFFLIILIAWIFSTNRRRLNWNAIIFGVLLQLIFALFVFKIPAGTKFFLFINDLVIKVIDASTAGSKFVFGNLAFPPGVEGSPGFILAFQGLPAIIFFPH